MVRDMPELENQVQTLLQFKVPGMKISLYQLYDTGTIVRSVPGHTHFCEGKFGTWLW